MADRNPVDVLVGSNLAALRGGMSQQALAQAMRERGWKWSQATVWAVESGERPLRLTEAADLMAILRPDRARMVGDLLAGARPDVWGLGLNELEAQHRTLKARLLAATEVLSARIERSQALVHERAVAEVIAQNLAAQEATAADEIRRASAEVSELEAALAAVGEALASGGASPDLFTALDEVAEEDARGKHPEAP